MPGETVDLERAPMIPVDHIHIKQKVIANNVRIKQIPGFCAVKRIARGRSSFERYGVWGDFDEPYLTLLPKYEAAQPLTYLSALKPFRKWLLRRTISWSKINSEASLQLARRHFLRLNMFAFSTSQDKIFVVGTTADGHKSPGFSVQRIPPKKQDPCHPNWPPLFFSCLRLRIFEDRQR